jgi:hypothetical protein
MKDGKKNSWYGGPRPPQRPEIERHRDREADKRDQPEDALESAVEGLCSSIWINCYIVLQRVLAPGEAEREQSEQPHPAAAS